MVQTNDPTQEPTLAAKRLVAVAAEPDPTSPRFLNLEGDDCRGDEPKR